MLFSFVSRSLNTQFLNTQAFGKVPIEHEIKLALQQILFVKEKNYAQITGSRALCPIMWKIANMS